MSIMMSGFPKLGLEKEINVHCPSSFAMNLIAIAYHRTVVLVMIVVVSCSHDRISIIEA